MYGVEAAGASPMKVANWTASVIDFFKSGNNSHDANQFFSTITGSKNDLDPSSTYVCKKGAPDKEDCLQKRRRNGQVQKQVGIGLRHMKMKIIAKPTPTSSHTRPQMIMM